MRAGRIVLVLLLAGAGGYAAWHYGLVDRFAGKISGNQQEAGQGQQQQGRRGAGAGGGGRRGGGGQSADIPVIAAPVRIETVPVYRDGIGNVQAFAMVTIRPQVDGRLMSVAFKEGQYVKKGDVLARIDPVVYQAQLDQALAKKAQDQANLANARVDLERYERLASSNAGSKQQADAQRAMVAQVEAQVKADDAAIDNARAYLGYTTIASPIEGPTGIRQVDPGNIIRSSDAAGLVTIAQVKPINVVFTLPQRDLQVVSAAMRKGVVTAVAREADGRVLGTGRLDVMDNQVDTTTGTVKLKASFPNEDQGLWPGQFVTVRLTVEMLENAKVVPTPAIRRGPNGTFVYVVDGNRARVTPVEVAQQDETLAVLRAGPDAGTRVVTTGFTRLADGRTVAVTESEDGAVPALAPAAPRRRPQNGEGEGGARRRDGQGPPRPQAAQDGERRG